MPGDTANQLGGDGPGPAVSRAGDELYLQLHLLDRQVVDSDERLVCKVDDLELELDAAGRPYVVAILCGPMALGPRLGGRLGRWVGAIARRLSPAPDPTPGRIDFGLVTEIGSAVTVAASGRDLGVNALEDWVNTYVIDPIPGSRHAGE